MMKAALALLFTTPLTLGHPNPITNTTSPDLVVASPLEARASCQLHERAHQFQPLGCDVNAVSGQRKCQVRAGDRFDTYCSVAGQSVDWTFPGFNPGRIRPNVWYYVQGAAWDCYIWYGFVPESCSGKFDTEGVV